MPSVRSWWSRSGVVRGFTSVHNTSGSARESGEIDSRLGAMLAALPDLIFFLSRTGVYLDFHALDDEELYLKPPVFLGKRVVDVMPVALAETIMEYIRRALNSQTVQVLEYELDMAEGERHHYEGRFAAVGEEEVMIIVRNITDRKQAEAALRESEAMARAFFDALADVIFIIDPAGTILVANEAAAELLNRPAGSLVGKMAVEIFPFELVTRRCAVGTQVFNTDRPVRFEDQLGDMWFDIVIYPISDPDGTVTKIAVFARNITDRKHAEEAYHLLVEHSLQGLIIFQDDHIVFANAQAAKLAGYEENGLIGRSISEMSALLHPADRERILGYAHYHSQHGAVPNHHELRIITRNGELRWVGVYAVRIIYRGKLAVQAALLDITEQRETAEALKQRNVELAALNAIATTVGRSLNLNQILTGVIDELLRLGVLGAGAGIVISLVDRATNRAVPAAWRYHKRSNPCLYKVVHSLETGELEIMDEHFAAHKHIRLLLKVWDEKLGLIQVCQPGQVENNLSLWNAVADLVAVAVENAQLFAEVGQQREQLRALTIRLSDTEEAERRHLARQLHDLVGQNLTALGVNLNIVQSQMAADNSKPIRNFLAESVDLVKQITKCVREVMVDLHPPVLDDYGLVAALHWYGTQVAARSDFEVVVQGETIEPALASTISSTMFRVAQEALTNVAKHAQASKVTISIEQEAGWVRMLIADDGVGFEPSRVAGPGASGGWGLILMAERAAALGGRCQIESSVGGGTRVIVEVAR